MIYFTKPVPFKEAVEKLGTKKLAGKLLNSEQWAEVPVAIRDRSFFSATIENARFLQSSRNFVQDFLLGAVETLPSGETALKANSRAEFVKQFQAFCSKNGMGDILPPGVGREERSLIERVKDIKSSTRLRVIFDTQVRQAKGYGWWKQGNDQAILDAFPAQRFIRGHDVAVPRPLHAENEGAVRRKDDIAFWRKMNSPSIGGFDVPWPPFGFNSGMDVEDVERVEAEKLGMIQPGEQIKCPEIKFNTDLKASLRGLDPDMREKLKQVLGTDAQIKGDRVELKPKADEPVTLEKVLEKVGLANKEKATADAIAKLVEELKEVNPIKESELLLRVNTGKSSKFTEKVVREQVQEFLNFIPPAVAKKLPRLKIDVLANLGGNARGEYAPGGKLRMLDGLSEKQFKRTLFHELMHWLHLDGPSDDFRKTVKEHFKARTKGEVMAILEHYGCLGLHDKWYDQYAGKVYPRERHDPKGTEMVTRYFEWLTMKKKEMVDWWNDADFRETLLIVLKGLF